MALPEEETIELTFKHIIIIPPIGEEFMFKLKPAYLSSEVLEAVCQTLKLSADKHELRYFNQALSPLLQLWSYLPNGAQVEVHPSLEKAPSLQIVMIFEDGQTVENGMFTATDSLWKVVVELCPVENTLAEECTVSYISKEFIGKKVLERTTLGDLGANEGVIPLRYHNKYISFKSKKKEDSELKPTKSLPEMEVSHHKNKSDEQTKETKAESWDSHTLEELSQLGGDREGLVLYTNPTLSHKELADVCFELPIERVREMQKEIKAGREEFYAYVGQELKMYYKGFVLDTKIGVLFPNGVILQGTFTQNETIGDVIKFVQEYLEDPNMEFYLYTPTPKMIMEDEETLSEINCMSSAMFYLGLDKNSPLPKDSPYLKKEYLKKLCQTEE